MDQVGAYDLQLANRLIENDKDKAADILARFFNRDERIKEEVHRYLLGDSNNGQDAVVRSSRTSHPVEITLNPAPRGPARSTSSQHSGSSSSPPPHRTRVRRELHADPRSYPVSPPTSSGSRSARGETATKEYILVPCVFGSRIEEKLFRLKTAQIPHSVIREEAVSRLGDSVVTDAEDNTQILVPHPADHSLQIPVRVEESVTLTWRRPHSDATHDTTFFLVPKDMLNTDVLLGYVDSGEGHPEPLPVQQPHRQDHMVHQVHQVHQAPRPPAPSPPSQSYHYSHADPTFHQTDRQTRCRTEEYVAQHSPHDPAPRVARLPQQSRPSTVVGVRPSRPDHSIPSDPSATHGNSVSGNTHSDPDRKLRLELEWGVTVINVWLYLDSSADAFFHLFQQQASKRKTMPDRSLITIYLTPDRDATDEAAHALSLDQDDMEADWDRTVEWLERNRREQSPHLFGTVDVEGG